MKKLWKTVVRHNVAIIDSILRFMYEFPGDQEAIDKFSRRTVRVTSQHNDEVKKLLKLMGIPYVEVITSSFWIWSLLVRSQFSVRLHVKLKLSALIWPKQGLSLLQLRRIWIVWHSALKSFLGIWHLARQSNGNFGLIYFCICWRKIWMNCRKMPIKEIHLDKVLSELKLNQDEVSAD